MLLIMNRTNRAPVLTSYWEITIITLYSQIQLQRFIDKLSNIKLIASPVNISTNRTIYEHDLGIAHCVYMRVCLRRNISASHAAASASASPLVCSLCWRQGSSSTHAERTATGKENVLLDTIRCIRTILIDGVLKDYLTPARKFVVFV